MEEDEIKPMTRAFHIYSSVSLDSMRRKDTVTCEKAVFLSFGFINYSKLLGVKDEMKPLNTACHSELIKL